MPRKTTAPQAGLRNQRSTRVIIGKRIALRRAALGWSQPVLASKFGVSRSTLAQYEVGIGDLNAGDMNFLAEILDVPILYFFMPDYIMPDEIVPDITQQMNKNLTIVQAYLPLLPLNLQGILVDMTLSITERARQKNNTFEFGLQIATLHAIISYTQGKTSPRRVFSNPPVCGTGGREFKSHRSPSL